MAQRISIGFQASPPLALRVSDDELGRLNDALGGEGWHEITAEDGTREAEPRARAVAAHRVRRAPRRVRGRRPLTRGPVTGGRPRGPARRGR